MADKNHYDLAVIGAGPGGYVCAIRAAQLGLSVALVEKEATLGGTCLNIGCIPSKTLLDSSERFYEARTAAAEHGIKIKGVTLDLRTMMKRKDKVVRKLTGGLKSLMKHHGVEVVGGRATIPEPGRITVRSTDVAAGTDEGERTLSAQHIVLATGSVPTELPAVPFDGKRVVSSTEALAFTEVPARLAVIGAGAIGLELGSVWQRLGSEVTVVEILPRLLPGFDSEAAKLLQKELQRQGMRFHLETRVTGLSETGAGVELTMIDNGDSEHKLEADTVLVAVGRQPYVEGLGLEQLGIARAEDGKRLKVDAQYRTSIDGVYAIGDLIHGPMLTHKTEEAGVAVAELAADGYGHVNYEAVPNVVYTNPEVAAVGRNEAQLKETGVAYRVGRFAFSANGRALASAADRGMVKVLSDERTDRVLGAQIIGSSASELISELVTVMEFGGSAEDIARICHAHPTLSEAVKEAALSVAGRAIHSI